jgi:hypothetical protein
MKNGELEFAFYLINVTESRVEQLGVPLDLAGEKAVGIWAAVACSGRTPPWMFC